MVKFASLLLACFLFTLPAQALPAPATKIPAIQPLIITYDIYVGGLHLITAEAFFQRKGLAYRTDVKARTYGMWYKIFPWNTELRAKGKVGRDRFLPTSFYTRDVWNEKPRKTWLNFKPNGDVVPTFDPPNTDKDREKVSSAQRKTSLDPVSGLLQLIAHTHIAKNCNVTVPVFDGKRRFNITGVDQGFEELDDSDYSAFKGKARACDAQFTMVAGEWNNPTKDRFWKRDDGDNSREPFHIHMAKLDATLPELPVRLESGSVWGIIVMHLTSWRYAKPGEAPR